MDYAVNLENWFVLQKQATWVRIPHLPPKFAIIDNDQKFVPIAQLVRAANS